MYLETIAEEDAAGGEVGRDLRKPEGPTGLIVMAKAKCFMTRLLLPIYGEFSDRLTTVGKSH